MLEGYHNHVIMFARMHSIPRYVVCFAMALWVYSSPTSSSSKMAIQFCGPCGNTLDISSASIVRCDCCGSMNKSKLIVFTLDLDGILTSAPQTTYSPALLLFLRLIISLLSFDGNDSRHSIYRIYHLKILGPRPRKLAESVVPRKCDIRPFN